MGHTPKHRLIRSCEVSFLLDLRWFAFTIKNLINSIELKWSSTGPDTDSFDLGDQRFVPKVLNRWNGIIIRIRFYFPSWELWLFCVCLNKTGYRTRMPVSFWVVMKISLGLKSQRRGCITTLQRLNITLNSF